ncbi:quercetin 2,3-dioxygenase [Alloacidobacterium sp.]|uniref:quercetin 2,3-dioxygenase n=1 Tax=Alloacidobacterium sp. TaxID=2951999 RepID=UPI002D531798|nr:quercetin 2,3-dioxygenase [Alloacidobacterium sp.]HYK36726.1 quercetin 2,3-dioxygenase [Alloacidobacterium sp.]
MSENVLDNTASSVLETGQGESFWLLGDFYSIKTSSAQTAGAYSITEIQSFPGNGPPPHIHQREDECLYIVEGAFSIILGDRVFDVADGDFVRISKGTPHTYRNVGAIPGKMLVVLSPGGFERMWAELGQPGSVNQPPKDDPSSLNRLLALAPGYGLEICG